MLYFAHSTVFCSCSNVIFWKVSPLNSFCIFAKNQLAISVQDYLWMVRSVPLICSPIPHCPDNCDFIISLKIRSCDSPNILIFPKNYPVPFYSILGSACLYLQESLLGVWLVLCYITVLFSVGGIVIFSILSHNPWNTVSLYTGWGENRFTVVSVENNTIYNNTTY